MANTPFLQGEADAASWDHESGKLYALIGNEIEGAHFMRYDPRVNRWEALPMNPEWDCLGEGAALASLGRFGVYALQGACFQNSDGRAFAHYDPFRLEWSELPSLPEGEGASRGASLMWAGAFDHQQATFIYAFGGGQGNLAPSNGFYRFRIDDNRWQQLADLLCPIGAFTGNRMGYFDGAVHYWQGAPDNGRFACDGGAFLELRGL